MGKVRTSQLETPQSFKDMDKLLGGIYKNEHKGKTNPKNAIVDIVEDFSDYMGGYNLESTDEGVDRRVRKNIIQKATLDVAEVHAEAANPEEVAQDFILFATMDKPVSEEVTIDMMSSYRKRGSTFDMRGNVLYPAPPSGSTMPAAQKFKPTLGHYEMFVDEYLAEIDIYDDVLEDNLMENGLGSYILKEAYSVIGSNIENLLINGDTASADPLLGSKDGILARLTSNIFDLAGANMTELDYLRTQLLTPTNFRRANEANMKMFVADVTNKKLQGMLGGHGNSIMEQELRRPVTQEMYGGKLISAPYIDELVGGLTRTSAFYIDPKQVHLGFWRKLRMETFRNPGARATTLTFSMRFDIALPVEQAAVKVINIDSDKTTL